MFALAAAAVTLAVTGPVATAPASPALRFHSAQYDSPGTDNRSAASLNAEWISLINSGPAAVRLTGWSIRDAAGKVFTFGNVQIAGKGGRVWLHTGTGTGTATDQFWNSRAYIWNNTGDTAQLRTPAGLAHDTCSWTNKAGRTVVGC
jgi:hypothetical protein